MAACIELAALPFLKIHEITVSLALSPNEAPDWIKTLHRTVPILQMRKLRSRDLLRVIGVVKSMSTIPYKPIK